MIQHLERQILELHERLTLRPVLDDARKIGELLQEAKSLLPHGKWQPWCRRMGLSNRTARVYVQVSKTAELCHFDAKMSINQFLGIIRQAHKTSTREERQEARDVAIADGASPSRRYRVVQADCRKYRWPQFDTIATDPPWQDMDAYSWLATFARENLPEGGTVLCQCGTSEIADVTRILVDGGLSFVWMLAMVFPGAYSYNRVRLAIGWRAVLLLTKGKWRHRDLSRVSDTALIKQTRKEFGDWEQPLAPWVKWVEALSRPGEMIVDPFAGCGTIGVASKIIGGRSYLGTEIDADNAKIAASRLSRIEEGKNPE